MQANRQLLLSLKKRVWFWRTQLSHGPQYSGITREGTRNWVTALGDAHGDMFIMIFSHLVTQNMQNEPWDKRKVYQSHFTGGENCKDWLWDSGILWATPPTRAHPMTELLLLMKKAGSARSRDSGIAEAGLGNDLGNLKAHKVSCRRSEY